MFLKPESTCFIYRIHSVDKDAGKRQERHQWLSPLGGPDHIQLCEFTAGSYSWLTMIGFMTNGKDQIVKLFL